MESLRVRKTRLSLVVETLEDRRLLSLPGLPSGWDNSTLAMANHAVMAPPIQGSMDPSKDNANPPGSGSMDRPSSPRASESSSNAPSSSAPGNDCAPSTPTVGSRDNANPADPRSDRGWAEGLASAGNVPTWGGLASPTPASVSQLAERTAAPSNASGINPASTGGDPSVNTPSRGGSPESIARSNPNVVQTSHVENVGPANSESLGRSPASESPLHATVNIPGGPDVAPGTSSPHGASAFEISTSQGWPIAQARAALESGVSKDVSDPRSTDEVPPTSTWEPGTEGQMVVASLARTRPGEGLEKPDPQLADMIMSLLPFDRSSMEDTIDRFLEPLDDLASWMPGPDGYMGLVTASLTVAVTVLTADISLRIRRSREDETEREGEEYLVGFPGLPGARRLSRS